MYKQYSKDAPTLTSFALTADMHADIGRLIRACAEIEDLVALHLCQVAEIDESQSAVLLGRMPSSTRVSLAKTFADRLGGTAQKAHDKCFDGEYFGMISVRNVLTHGTLLGISNDGRVTFRTNEILGPQENSGVRLNVVSYLPEGFRKWADQAEATIPLLEETLRLQAWREKRRQQDLLPHRKSQPTRPPSAKPKLPPLS